MIGRVVMSCNGEMFQEITLQSSHCYLQTYNLKRLTVKTTVREKDPFCLHQEVIIVQPLPWPGQLVLKD